MKPIIHTLRNKIDKIDHQLIVLLSKRVEIVKEIGKIKNKKNLPALDANRWNEVVQSRLAQAEKLKLSKEFVIKVYTLIHQHSLDIENESE